MNSNNLYKKSWIFKLSILFIFIFVLSIASAIIAQIDDEYIEERNIFITKVKPLNIPQLIFNKLIKFFYMANGIFFSHFICFVLTGLIFLMVNSERKRTGDPYYLFLTIAFSLLSLQRLLLSTAFGIDVIKRTSTFTPFASLQYFLNEEPFIILLENIPEQFAFVLLVAAFLHQILTDKNKIKKALKYSLFLLFVIDFTISFFYISSFNIHKIEFYQHWSDPVLKIIDCFLLLTIMITIMNSLRHTKYLLMSSYSLWFLSKYLHLYSTIAYGEPTRYFSVMGNTLPIIIFILLTMALYRHIAKENVELEREILDSKDKLQAIFDGITDGILIIDRDFNILNFNDSEKLILDKEVEELSLKEKCYVAYKRGNEPCADCPAVQTFITGKVNVSNFTGARKPSGKKIHYDVYSFPIKNESREVNQMIIYIKDVTETKNMFDKMMDLDRLATIGEMSTRVAHEIRNPLDAISGSAAYLSKTIESDIVTEFTNIIMEETDRLFNLTSNLLTFAKPMPPNFRENNINTVILDTFKVLRAEIDETSIITEFDLYEGMPKFNFDGSQIKQAIMNLVINALEAMPDGGTLKVKTHISSFDHSNAEDGSLRKRLSKQEFFLLNYDSSATLSFTDSGMGIKKENIDNLYKPFFTTKAKGSGLGLAITHKVIRNHYGIIEVNSKLNEGSSFTIHLPIQ